MAVQPAEGKAQPAQDPAGPRALCHPQTEPAEAPAPGCASSGGHPSSSLPTPGAGPVGGAPPSRAEPGAQSAANVTAWHELSPWGACSARWAQSSVCSFISSSFGGSYLTFWRSALWSRGEHKMAVVGICIYPYLYTAC